MFQRLSFLSLLLTPLAAFGHDGFWTCSYVLVAQKERPRNYPKYGFPEREDISQIIEGGTAKEIRQLMVWTWRRGAAGRTGLGSVLTTIWIGCWVTLTSAMW